MNEKCLAQSSVLTTVAVTEDPENGEVIQDLVPAPKELTVGGETDINSQLQSSRKCW